MFGPNTYRPREDGTVLVSSPDNIYGVFTRKYEKGENVQKWAESDEMSE